MVMLVLPARMTGVDVNLVENMFPFHMISCSPDSRRVHFMAWIGSEMVRTERDMIWMRYDVDWKWKHLDWKPEMT